jgi:hypothetical protein
LEPYGELGVWLREADGAGTVVTVGPGGSAVDAIVSLADEVQEWAVEALFAVGLPPVWPECPDHPDSHPLDPRRRGGVAVWQCPRSGVVVAQIGSLESGFAA